jgi:4-hydroxy-3-methylbut-2-enyl diphosphate reductase
VKVFRAGVTGFCMGVRRAVDAAFAAASAAGVEPAAEPDAPPVKVYTLGALIHNPQVLESLRERGIAILDENRIPGNLENTAVIIRAHGIPPRLESLLKARGASVTDATCPRVKASQMKARSLAEGGYRIFLAGEKDHEEVIGIEGYAPGCIVVAGPGEAAAAAEKLAREEPRAKTALIGQSTISPGEYGAVEGEIRRFFPGLIAADTICGATRDRQRSLRELCARVDAVIIAGGRDSANTRRLLGIAESLGKPAWLVESAEEIPREIAAYDRVGIGAGASTPDEVIDAIEAALVAMGEDH